jgi:mannose-1-phosphate guanylyltransferase
MYAVVLAGGGGTRLWPLSRPERPKPFLPLLGPRTLLQQTVDRLAPLIEPADVYVVTDQRYAALVREQLPEVPGEHVVGEPIGRNTAAAVAMAALMLDRPDDDVMAILPADHEVRDEASFRESLAAAADVAADHSFVTLGIEPDGPATRFGYILRRGEAARVRNRDTYRVDRFVEKPDESRAIELLATGAAYWNAGIFVWRRDDVVAGLSRHAADIVDALGAGLERGEDLPALYPSLRATSIDYALLEPASLEGNVSVVPSAVGWSDIGSWGALLDAIAPTRTNDAKSRVLQPGDTVVVTTDDVLLFRDDGRLVLAEGSNATIEPTTTTALLVGARERMAEIEALVDRVSAYEPQA